MVAFTAGRILHEHASEMAPQLPSSTVNSLEGGSSVAFTQSSDVRRWPLLHREIQLLPERCCSLQSKQMCLPLVQWEFLLRLQRFCSLCPKRVHRLQLWGWRWQKV